MCTAVLDGTKDVGEDARITASISTPDGRTHAQLVRIRVYALQPDTIKIKTTHDVLRPIAGLYDSSDTACKTPVFQTATVTATATFSDGKYIEFKDYDVSSWLRLASSDESLAVVEKPSRRAAPTVQGKNEEKESSGEGAEPLLVHDLVCMRMCRRLFSTCVPCNRHIILHIILPGLSPNQIKHCARLTPLPLTPPGTFFHRPQRVEMPCQWPV